MLNDAEEEATFVLSIPLRLHLLGWLVVSVDGIVYIEDPGCFSFISFISVIGWVLFEGEDGEKETGSKPRREASSSICQTTNDCLSVKISSDYQCPA